jgi:hypothetical protein
MKKPYRSIDFNDERKWKSNYKFDDILQVGIQKAIGYTAFTESEMDDLKDLENQFINNGKITHSILNPKGFAYNINVLWVGDLKMIQSILDPHKDYLRKKRYPVRAKNFFLKICEHHVDHDKDEKLYHIITDLYNSWCLWCEKLTCNKSGKVPQFLSTHPYDPDLE